MFVTGKSSQHWYIAKYIYLFNKSESVKESDVCTLYNVHTYLSMQDTDCTKLTDAFRDVLYSSNYSNSISLVCQIDITG